MSGLRDLDLIHFFDFYLATTFLLSTAARVRQYAAALALVRGFPSRWPKLMALMKQHHGILLTWRTMAPAALALGLLVVQMLASRVFWEGAQLTLGDLAAHPLAVPFVALFGLGMLAVDLYFILVVAPIDRPAVEKYLDQAEFWLKSWAAPVVRTVTFGRVNPRDMVAAEVRTALTSAGRELSGALWWVVLQTALRIAYGLSLWITYARTR